uniref:Methyltransferase domain-containing protein n=1 Tax=candidate division CPR3 bacterium TaxID=2268181 RepID=A0A7V3JA75_UNCC3
MGKKLMFGQKIMLDVGCGENKQEGFVGMDRRKVKGVDIVHDAEDFPWPLDDESCAVVSCRHLVEHIKPWLTIQFFDEAWRVLRDGGVMMIVTPYAGSFGFWQDPTHCNGFNEATFAYFDPEHPSGLYYIYKPKPWKVEHLSWSVVGNIEAVLRKRGKYGEDKKE